MRELIESISHRIAMKLKEANPDETASVEVMSYALQGILQNSITIITALAVGIITGHFGDVLFAAICFTVLRFVSGGFHFKSAFTCFLFSTIVFSVIPFIQLNSQWLLGFNIINFLLAFIYAPSNIKEHIRISDRFFPVFKLLSLLLVTINFFYLSPIVTISFLAQCLSLISFKRR